MADIVTYEFTDTDWHLLSADPDALTVKNKSGHTISILIKDTDELPDDNDLLANGINPPEIGGMICEISTQVNEYIFAKSVSGQGLVTIRPFGTLDPSEDITHLADVLGTLQNVVNDHRDNTSNPHQVTKEQVGLGNIPNNISDDEELNAPDTLATTVATKNLYDKIQAHEDRQDNPHLVLKEHVELGNVANYSPATEVTGKDSTRSDLYMTPKSTYEAVKAWIQIAMSMKPQTVSRGQIKDRPLGWSNLDCSAPSNLMEKLTDTSIRINAGLGLAFAEEGKTRESFVLTENTTIELSGTPQNGVHYVYADIDELASISGFGTTMTRYKEGMLRDGHVGDFFSVAQNVMYNSTDEPIRRVYIGKIYVDGNIIQSVLGAPIGEEVILPVTQELILSGRDLYQNPFLGPTDVYAQVEYNFEWGVTGWNDQIGVVAHPHPTNPIDRIIVQTGMMGFLSSGKEAGSPFSANFATVTVAPRARIVVRKKF